MPYYLGGEIKKREALNVQTPISLLKRLNLDVRCLSEVWGTGTFLFLIKHGQLTGTHLNILAMPSFQQKKASSAIGLLHISWIMMNELHHAMTCVMDVIGWASSCIQCGAWCVQYHPILSWHLRIYLRQLFDSECSSQVVHREDRPSPWRINAVMVELFCRKNIACPNQRPHKNPAQRLSILRRTCTGYRHRPRRQESDRQGLEKWKYVPRSIRRSSSVHWSHALQASHTRHWSSRKLCSAQSGRHG